MTPFKYPVTALQLAGLFALLAAANCGRAQAYTAVDLGSFTPTSINDSGTVVGYAQPTSPYAVEYSDSQLLSLNLGGDWSEALGINNLGTVVGYTYDNTAGNTAFSFSNGQATALSIPGEDQTIAFAINDAGTIVGSAQQGAQVQPFSVAGGVVTLLGSAIGLVNSGNTFGRAVALNDAGLIAGNSTLGEGTNFVGFTYASGAASLVVGSGSQTGTVAAINDAGTIVGTLRSGRGGGIQGAVIYYSNGQTTTFATQSNASGVNASGAVVGADNGVAFVYRDGAESNLNSLVHLPGDLLTEAVAINDGGQIVAVDASGEAFLLTPIPEPASGGAFLGAVVLGVAWLWRRRLGA